MNKFKLLIIVSLCCLNAKVTASLIDFEKLPSGLPAADNYVIGLDDIFCADGVKVKFGFDSDLDGEVDSSAVYEEAGNKDSGKDTGFHSMRSKRDEAAPGFKAQLGDFFLRQSEPYKPFGTFVITYDADKPVTGASGEIWDIDGNSKKNKLEQFMVQAFGSSGLLQSIMSPIGKDSSLDGKPWLFEFEGLSNIERIEISFVGTKKNGIGLAFNNFAPTMSAAQLQSLATISKVVEPSVLLLFSFSIMVFAVMNRFSVFKVTRSCKN